MAQQDLSSHQPSTGYGPLVSLPGGAFHAGNSPPSRRLTRRTDAALPRRIEEVPRPDLDACGDLRHANPFNLMLRSSAPVRAPADNNVPVAGRLLTLTDHPGLDLIIVLNGVGDGANASPSGLVMEIPRFHDRLRMRTNARGRCRFRNRKGTLTFDRTFSRRCNPFVL